jgi:pimeloyl-ACP methyl ester carboxylesterase
MTGPVKRFVEANGIRLHIAEQGDGPLVLLCHGFPESWYSWRHQLSALAAAGFRAVAPDMRGYGRSDAPEAIDRYTSFHLVGDMVGILDALEAETAVIVGHDLGARVAWQAAQLRPDRFRGVVGLSVPLHPRGAAPPTSVMPRTADAQFYQLYFQQPGPADAEFARDPRATIRNMLFGASGEAVASRTAAAATGGTAVDVSMVPHGAGFLRGPAAPAALPDWIAEEDIDFYAAEFTRTGFTGALNWYRNIDRNWELQAALQGLPVTVPALYVVGDRDFVMLLPGMDRVLANLRNLVPALRGVHVVPGCGHWTQQERPQEVNAAIVAFLRGLPA